MYSSFPLFFCNIIILGEWNTSVIEGHGIYTHVDGRKFEGEFEEGFRVVNGSRYLLNGDPIPVPVSPDLALDGNSNGNIGPSSPRSLRNSLRMDKTSANTLLASDGAASNNNNSNNGLRSSAKTQETVPSQTSSRDRSNSNSNRPSSPTSPTSPTNSNNNNNNNNNTSYTSSSVSTSNSGNSNSGGTSSYTSISANRSFNPINKPKTFNSAIENIKKKNLSTPPKSNNNS